MHFIEIVLNIKYSLIKQALSEMNDEKKLEEKYSLAK